ncbi:PREDICTED: LOW QUALITY PROTEIN: scopoletin glucosyltransferase [Theobroma cacao]|uniref:LOW QUALITY PROTEIN: scopoletin glucosyltransferase n=1 Tax=Theobroma cacao TaxID=3641 RepID=A0AB32VHC3_THECC|nr:PREDICTED: LOW QUALITY PROTEIN: scopoletin glucosyltransferase [Theobroma cacao]
MDTESHQLHMFFIPFLAPGHMIPAVDMAKMFAMRGAQTTIITTPFNASLFSNTIQRCKNSDLDIDIKVLKFPCVEVGLPEGCENLDLITTPKDANREMVVKFCKGAAMLQEPLEQLLQELKPDCIVADVFLHWTFDAANKFGIPRFVFHGTGFFSLCGLECMRLYEPQKKVESDSEPFVVTNLPGDVKLTRKQLSDFIDQRIGGDFTQLLIECKVSELKSYGVVVNSFYELEATYADYFRNVMGRKAWHIGPVSQCNRGTEEKAERGNEASIDEQECLKWLDSKKPKSVVYVSFGSTTNFAAAQLMEIAMGLEASGQQFIWVVRKKKNKEEKEDWLPEGFEKKMEGKGLIIRGWAPQMLIPDHEAVGGFVTHCGWNSTLEGVTAGVPMVTWPLSAEQFLNEKFVTDVLKIGIVVGIQQSVKMLGNFVKRETIQKAVKEIMAGDRAHEMRKKAKALGEMAKTAVEKGGSSYTDLGDLIAELSLRRHSALN